MKWITPVAAAASSSTAAVCRRLQFDCVWFRACKALVGPRAQRSGLALRCATGSLRSFDSGSRRITRCTHCVRFAQTDAASMFTKRAGYARRPRVCGARLRQCAVPAARPKPCRMTVVRIWHLEKTPASHAHAGRGAGHPAQTLVHQVPAHPAPTHAGRHQDRHRARQHPARQGRQRLPFQSQALAKVFRAKVLDATRHAGLTLPAALPDTWVVDCRCVGDG